MTDTCGQLVTIDGATFACNLGPGHQGYHQAQGDVPVRFTLVWRVLT